MTLDALQERLGYRFRDPELLLRAVTHSSFGHEHAVRDYERLEFLGDAVLQMCTTLLLIQAFPAAREGELSRMRSKLVNTKALAELATDLGIGGVLRLGRGEEDTGGRDRTSNLADATEAILGAVYRDSGFSDCRSLVERWMRPRIAALGTAPEQKIKWKDPKSRLQEHTQQDGGSTPTYEVVGHEGPPHAPVFHVAALLDGVEIGRGSGASKRAATRAAAESALASLGADG